MMEDATLVAFARRCLEPLLGKQPAGRFFLAGGAFKSLLHGRPPRDLDLWPATQRDRELLAAQLVHRGARPHRDNPPYQTSYSHAGHLVELAHDVSAEGLEDRLMRFDLALSAIGVEHRDGAWRGSIHPLALKSIRLRQVLLLKPLVNWKYALATLARLRRYATELGFGIPPGEEQTIWTTYDQQPREEQKKMIARYLRVSRGDESILDEATEPGRTRMTGASPAGPVPMIAGLYFYVRGGVRQLPRVTLEEIPRSLEANPWYRDRLLVMAGDEACASLLSGYGLRVHHVFGDAPPHIHHDAAHRMKHWMCLWALRTFGEFLWVDWDTVALREPDEEFWSFCRTAGTPRFIRIPGYWATVNCGVYYADAAWTGPMERSFSAAVATPNDELLWRSVLPERVAERPEFWWGDRVVNVWTEAELDRISARTVFAHVRDLSWAPLVRDGSRRLRSVDPQA